MSDELHLDAKSKAELSVKLDNLISQMKNEVQKLEQGRKVSDSLARS